MLISCALQFPDFSLIQGQQRLCIVRVGILASQNSFLRLITPIYLNFSGNIPVRIPYVKYEDKSIVSNTRWSGIRIKHALPREFSVPMA
jgi:hypothetical protein